MNKAYLALPLREALDLLVERINLELLLLVLLLLAIKLVFDLSDALRLLRQLLRELLVLLDLLGERDLDAPLTLLQLLDLGERGPQRDSPLLFEGGGDGRNHATR